jgi:prephenate dehydrogenase
MTIRSIGIIGYGAFGQFVHTFAKRFAPGVAVRVFSSKKRPDGKIFFSLEEVCATDAVVLCIPIHAFESMLQKVLPLIKPETVLVDVCTVKMHTDRLLKRYAKGKRYISSHPMFGPESYEASGKDVTGFRIVITKNTLKKPEYARVLSFLKSSGFDVIETTPEKHDRHLAETLFLTHFIGQTVDKAGFARTEIDTVSFKFLMNAVESVKNDTELFKDVFRFDPYCEKTLTKLENAETKTHALLRGSIRNYQ